MKCSFLPSLEKLLVLEMGEMTRIWLTESSPALSTPDFVEADFKTEIVSHRLSTPWQQISTEIVFGVFAKRYFESSNRLSTPLWQWSTKNWRFEEWFDNTLKSNTMLNSGPYTILNKKLSSNHLTEVKHNIKASVLLSGWKKQRWTKMWWITI